MERERWSELSAAVSKVDAGWEDPGRYTHRTAVVVRVHLWAVSHGMVSLELNGQLPPIGGAEDLYVMALMNAALPFMKV